MRNSILFSETMRCCSSAVADKRAVFFIKSFLLLLTSVVLFSFVQEAEIEPVQNIIRIERHKEIPMRDGVKLYADVYLPAKPGKYPTIVVRTPYGLQRDGVHQTMVKYAQHGYAVVLADVRGRYESEGKWEPFRMRLRMDLTP